MSPRRRSQLSSAQRGTNVLGPRIRETRKKLDPPVTQSDLAARLAILGIDLDRSTITRIENRERFLRDYEIKGIAKALKVSVAWLFSE